MKSTMTGSYVKNNENFDFNFETTLSAYDKLRFVNFVVDTLVDETRYDFIIKDLIFDFGIVKVFTNIDISFINIKDDDGNKINPIIPIEEFLKETNVVDIVKTNMELGLLDELNYAVNQSIEYRTGIHSNPLNKALTSLINTLERKINEVDLNSMMEMASKFNGITEDFTPENIVKAYMTTDTYKKNLVEIEESKKLKAEFAEDMDKAIVAVKNDKVKE